MSIVAPDYREVLSVRIDPELCRLVRIHRAETRETAAQLVQRLLTEEFWPTNPKPTNPKPKNPKPAA